MNWSYNYGRTSVRLMLTTDWPAGRAGELRYGMQIQGGEGYEATVPIEAVSIGPVPKSDRLLTLIGPFWEAELSKAWPGFLDMCEQVGFTAVSDHLHRVARGAHLEFYD